MSLKRTILELITRNVLLEIAHGLDIVGLTGQPKEGIIEALASKRSVKVETLLERLSRAELKAVCEKLGVDQSGREKKIIIQRILGAADAPEAKESLKKNADPVWNAALKAPDPQPYVHEDATVALRPEVGIQAQFKQKKQPKTYKYDSSLAPALEFDSQNSAREAGEKLIEDIVKANSIEEAKAAAVQLKAISKPFLNWAGKAERMSFDVPTMPLFVHERLSTKAIIETLKYHHKKKGDSSSPDFLDNLFGDPHRPITDQVLRAYEYQDKWVNRMILGDSMAVMNSLLHYEHLGGQVQMIYMDPPYGVRFGSNFQPFVRKNKVTHNDDDEMTREPEMVKAYRDTWELGLHSYLTYMRDRLLLCRELLKDSGSIFVQISDENVHHVRELMDEIFGSDNFISIISYSSTSAFETSTISRSGDYILWYARDKDNMLFNSLYVNKTFNGQGSSGYKNLEFPDGERLSIAEWEKRTGNTFVYDEHKDTVKVFSLDNITSQGPANEPQPFEFRGKVYEPKKGNHWKANYPQGMQSLKDANRIENTAKNIGYVRYFDDFPFMRITNIWTDTLGQNQFGYGGKLYVVQTSLSVMTRCLLMTTRPGDLVFDPTCGSGSMAYVSEAWGRRWITCDVSRVPLALARQKLLTATFPYYQLKDAAKGPSSGFIYCRKQNRKGEDVGGIVPHITLESIANNEPPKEEVLVDRPEVDGKITRITGPFVVEATIPAAMNSEDETGINSDSAERTNYIDRMLEVLRQSPVIHLPGKTLTLKNMRLPAKTLSLSAEALVPAAEIGMSTDLNQMADWSEEKAGRSLSLSDKPVAILFGPESGAISERMVYEAAKEAEGKKYAHLLVIGFGIQPMARELVEKCEAVMNIPASYIAMTPDLMMGDLLKNMRSSQIFSVCGLPDVKVERTTDGMCQVELRGLDIFDPATMEHQSLSGDDVPAWFLDTDYNGMCFRVCQAFFPRTAAWDSLKKALKMRYDEDVWEHLAGTKSAPFAVGEHKMVAVKVIDDRGNELLVTKKLEGVAE